MKTKAIYLTLIVALMSITSVFGQNKTEKFKVYGNCGMCENRIEKAAKGVDGVTSANWDKETKQIIVEFDKSKTNLDAIHKAIVKVGHDTEKIKAGDNVYNALPVCCQYDRKVD